MVMAGGESSLSARRDLEMLSTALPEKWRGRPAASSEGLPGLWVLSGTGSCPSCSRFGCSPLGTAFLELLEPEGLSARRWQEKGEVRFSFSMGMPSASQKAELRRKAPQASCRDACKESSEILTSAGEFGEKLHGWSSSRLCQTVRAHRDELGVPGPLQHPHSHGRSRELLTRGR